MEVTLALLADAANLSQEGKLNILGAFDRLSAAAFPARHPEMQLVMRFEASPAEYGMKKKIAIKLLDEDGAFIGGADAEAIIPPQNSGRKARIQHVLTMRDVVFPKAGDYVFAVLVDGRTEEEVPLQLVNIAEEQSNA